MSPRPRSIKFPRAEWASMKPTKYIKRGVAASVGALGVAAAANRALAGMAEDLDPPLPGDTGKYRWRGIDVTYTEAGDPEDPDLVLLHGIDAAATSYVYRGIVADLAEDHHVIVADLPGFGRSERPPLVYSASLYESFVTDLLEDLTDDPAVVASSLPAAYAAIAAQEVDVRRLVLVCPSASGMGGRSVALRTLLRSPVVGTAITNLITSKPALRYFSADHAYYDPAAITDEEIDYRWQSAHQPGARYAPASFVSGHLDADVDLADVLAGLDAPVTLVWGREAEVIPLEDGRELAEAADARLVVFDYSRLIPHAEHPETFVEFLDEELATTPESR